MIYEYPTVITYSKDDEVYYVDFPDISGCYTDGESLQEALFNAEDALNLMLSYNEEQGQVLPTPSEIKSIPLGSGQIVAMIKTDTVPLLKTAV